MLKQTFRRSSALITSSVIVAVGCDLRGLRISSGCVGQERSPRRAADSLSANVSFAFHSIAHNFISRWSSSHTTAASSTHMEIESIAEFLKTMFGVSRCLSITQKAKSNYREFGRGERFVDYFCAKQLLTARFSLSFSTPN